MRGRTPAALLFGLLFALACSIAFGQSGSTEDGSGMDPRDLLNDAVESGLVDETTAAGEVTDPAAPARPPAWVGDEATLTAYHEALRAYFDYRSRGLEHRTSVFEWQLFSARLIFCIVLLVVGTGIVLAIIQFRQESRLVREGKAAGLSSTDLEASPDGIKISSSIVGLLILTLSLGFFYLYLVYVYPIEDIF